jgi:hypothetical protein
MAPTRLYDRSLFAANTPSTTKMMQMATKIKKSTFAISPFGNTAKAK